MPLFFKDRIKNTSITLGIWKLTETEKEFKKLVPEESLVQARDAFPDGVRLMERLAVLKLLDLLLGDHGNLSHSSSGSPFLEGDFRPVSISHSRHWVAVAVSDEPDEVFGVDIQVSSSKTLDVLDRICQRSEAEPFGKEHLKEASLLLFSAKEAVYKCLDTPGAAYFLERQRASLDAFQLMGSLKVDYLDENGKDILQTLSVRYVFIYDCVLTLALKSGS